MSIDPRYPLGKLSLPESIPRQLRQEWIAELARQPDALRGAIRGLTSAQLDTPYRDGGWTVRQVVHHVPDSHLNAYVRTKLALTEASPTIRPYDERAWAALPDVAVVPLDLSLNLLAAVHERWLSLWRVLRDADFARTFVHPDGGKLYRLDQVLGIYAWHGRHHTAHVTALRARMQW